MTIAKGISNLFTLSATNILILLCIILIYLLIYLNTNTVELFDINNDDYLTSFITKYIKHIENVNGYKKTLRDQYNTIEKLSKTVINLINPTT